MSSFTTLGVNKNKKGFAPKISKRKAKSKSATRSTSLPTENHTIDETVQGNYTINESEASISTPQQIVSTPTAPPEEEYNDLGLTQEEMEINALVSRKRKQASASVENSLPKRAKTPMSPYYSAPSPTATASPAALDRPDCAFESSFESDKPKLKAERITPGPITRRPNPRRQKSMSRPLKEDEGEQVDVKVQLAQALPSSVPSSPMPAYSPSRSPSPPPVARRSGRAKQKGVTEDTDYAPDEDMMDDDIPVEKPSKVTKKTTKASTSKASSSTTKKAASSKKKGKVTASSSGSSIGIGIPTVSSIAIPSSIGAPLKTADDDDEIDSVSESEGGSSRKRRGRKRYEFRLLENLKTLDDITNDPAKVEYLDKPMCDFTKDMDGIVSKAFKEHETNRQEELKKLEDKAKMSEEELEALKKKEGEEAEAAARTKQIAKENEEERRKKEADGPVLLETSNAPQVRLVNGQIVLDTDSLTIERRDGGVTYADGEMEVVEESAMTRKVNSNTFGKRKQGSRWDAIETDQFYEYLSQFGTDFEMISMVMPGRTRNQIRLKFNREERAYPAKVTEYLIRKKKPLDIAKYEELAGVELEAVPEDFHEMRLS